MEPDVRLDVEGWVATVALNRPAALNALTIPMKERLLEVLRHLAGDRGVRAVVLTGAGRAFCAGQDLRERLEPGAPPLGQELRLRYNPIVEALRALPQPVLAAVNGVAAGAGASLAFACDLRIASETASFVLAFGRIGLVPDSGATWTLPRLVGAARAAEIALLNDPVSAAEALRIGLVSRVVAPDALAVEAAAIAARLAEGAPAAMTMSKRLLGAAFDRDLETALEAEAEAQQAAGSSRDHAEGLAAFTEKRPPAFTGE
ncbi:MAG: enoyl-CoA hydratase/isomerase family protein [Chloroflexi bacterium]|nr:enoyl-CoA hydratase/isomerase family protein [Chloroflexota bacterium]